jgi:hypothetical protein
MLALKAIRHNPEAIGARLTFRLRDRRLLRTVAPSSPARVRLSSVAGRVQHSSRAGKGLCRAALCQLQPDVAV